MISLTTDTGKSAVIPMKRRVRITLSIAGLGALAGGVAGGVLASVVVAILAVDARQLLDWFPYVIGAEFGAPLGAILLPIAAWTLMRHVTFGRAVLGTIAGALIGGFVGYFVSPKIDGPDVNALFRSLAGGVLGFALAAILLRLRARAASRVGASVV